jgi:hypothetical protein
LPRITRPQPSFPKAMASWSPSLLSTRESISSLPTSETYGVHVCLTTWYLQSPSQVKDEVYIYSKEGKELERLVPDFIGAASVSARWKDSWFFINCSGFTTPGTLGRYDFNAPEAQRWSIYHQTKVNGLDPDEFEATQVGQAISFSGTASETVARNGLRARIIKQEYQCLSCDTSPLHLMGLLLPSNMVSPSTLKVEVLLTLFP